MPLIFNQFNNTPPAPTATYYAHVVTTIPTGAETIVSALALANPSGYTPMSVVVNTVTNGGITNWTFNEVVWSPLNWNVSLCGTVIVLQTGASRNAAVDRPFLFYEFENGIQTPIVLTPGFFGLRFNSGLSFAFSTQPANKYDVGNFIGHPFYKDLLTLLTSNNGTKYTPVSALTIQQFNSATLGTNLNLNFLSYWTGDRVMTHELQGRHDIGYNNVTFSLLGSPVLGFNRAATFNGIDSFVTIGNTTLNGLDFNLLSTTTINHQLFVFYFLPTLNSTEEILLDTTTSNNSGGYIVRKTATNTIEFGFVTAGTPHTLVTFSSLNTITIGSWNFIMFGTYGTSRVLWVNNIRTLFNVAPGYTSPTLTNGIRLGARRGLNAALTGANFTGMFLYFASAQDRIPDGLATMPAIVNQHAQAPYNQTYNLGWSQTGSNTNAEMTTLNNFPANKSTFIRSIGNLDTYVGAQNLVGTTVAGQYRIDHQDCFYVNFGLNKVTPGTVAIIFPLGNTLNNIRLDAAANSAVFSVWGANSLPGNTPTNANLSNPALWDKYDFTITGITNSTTSNLTDFSGLSLTTSGIYRFHLLPTNITKSYKYLKLGWKNVVGVANSSNIFGFTHYLFYNSSVLSSSIDLIPPTIGYGA